ncbi:hypothetical protein CesoFtcFv8_011507 [Champsocephalus esox]|uniref:Uncharacterized protein n=1 Tax=Champsocephalus esox TaxID=159716 RepID=A0AAN8GWT2_9TELE|nr:hypothetical protein CesoFtcFv8_011507 [Champsocephalus esox]
MATHAMMPAYRVLYYGFLSTADKELYRESLELMYTKYHVNQAGRVRIKVVQEELNRKGMTPQCRERKKRVCQKLWHEETTTVLRLSIYMSLLAILKESWFSRVARHWFTNFMIGSLSCSWPSWLAS